MGFGAIETKFKASPETRTAGYRQPGESETLLPEMLGLQEPTPASRQPQVCCLPIRMPNPAAGKSQTRKFRQPHHQICNSGSKTWKLGGRSANPGVSDCRPGSPETGPKVRKASPRARKFEAMRSQNPKESPRERASQSESPEVRQPGTGARISKSSAAPTDCTTCTVWVHGVPGCAVHKCHIVSLTSFVFTSSKHLLCNCHCRSFEVWHGKIAHISGHRFQTGGNACAIPTEIRLENPS